MDRKGGPGAAPAASGVRLQRALAEAGIGSRRACELLIEDGRVEVDGVTVTVHGMRVDPERSVIRVDGSRVPTRRSLVYLAINKPRGVLTTMSDPRGRQTIADLVPKGERRRVFHVGRLDADSEGLLLLTNDGDLAHRLTHPSFGMDKTYLGWVSGVVGRGALLALRAGVDLPDGTLEVVRVRVVDRSATHSLVEVVVREGRKHVVRRALAQVGYPVERLVRTAVGPVRLGDLAPGKSRPLTIHEVRALYSLVDL